MFAPFARRYELLNFIREKNQADLVIVANGGKGENGGDLGREFALGLLNGAEESRSADVNEKHQGQFAFLDELFYERVIHPRGNVPVDRANFIAGLILAHLVEVHPLPFENAMVLAGESFAHETIRANLDLPDFFEDFSRNNARCEAVYPACPSRLRG